MTAETIFPSVCRAGMLLALAVAAIVIGVAGYLDDRYLRIRGLIAPAQ